MLERKAYLSNKTFTYFLASTILASMASTLGIVVDGVIVGQLLGTDQLAAVNLSGPLLQFFLTFQLLINSGNAIMMSYALGRNNVEEANRYFSVAMILNIAMGLLMLLCGILFSDAIASLLCSKEVITPFVEDYVQVVLLSAPIYFLLPGISYFIRADGAPKLTMYAIIIANVINLLLDIVFIKYMDLGIRGSSLATSCGYFVGIIILLSYFFKKGNRLKYVFLNKGCNIGKALLLGLPIALTSALVTLTSFSINHLIANVFSVFGLSVLAVTFSLKMLTTLIVGGTSQSIQPSGAYMIGQEDFQGLRFLVSKAFRMLCTLELVCLVLFLLFPNLILDLFGFNDLDRMGEAEEIVRIVALSFLPFAINYLTIVVFQLTQRTSLSLLVSILQPIMPVVLMFAFKDSDPLGVWWAFALGELVVILTMGILTLRLRKKDRSLSLYFLLKKPSLDGMMELSISNQDFQKDFPLLMDEVETFLVNNKAEDRLKYNVTLGMEEVVSNIIKYAYSKRKRKHYIDIGISITPEMIKLSIKDDGTAFDPLKYDNDSNIGIPLLKSICHDISYQYINGQNIVFLEFKRTSSD